MSHQFVWGGDHKIAIFPNREDHKIKYLFDRGPPAPPILWIHRGSAAIWVFRPRGQVIYTDCGCMTRLQSPPKESIHFCRAKYSKLREARQKVGGVPHPPLSWSKPSLGILKWGLVHSIGGVVHPLLFLYSFWSLSTWLCRKFTLPFGGDCNIWVHQATTSGDESRPGYSMKCTGTINPALYTEDKICSSRQKRGMILLSSLACNLKERDFQNAPFSKCFLLSKMLINILDYSELYNE